MQTSFGGTCSATAGGTFTFAGNVDGKAVVLKNNALYPRGPRLAGGKPMPCELKFSTSGTCTPCVFSIGSCGEAALDVFRARL